MYVGSREKYAWIWIAVVMQTQPSAIVKPLTEWKDIVQSKGTITNRNILENNLISDSQKN